MRDIDQANTFRLLVDDATLTTFSATWSSLNHVSVNFAQPVTTVRFQHVSGPFSMLGMDNLTAQIPEPVLATPLLLTLLGLRRVSRGRRTC